MRAAAHARVERARLAKLIDTFESIDTREAWRRTTPLVREEIPRSLLSQGSAADWRWPALSPAYAARKARLGRLKAGVWSGRLLAESAAGRVLVQNSDKVEGKMLRGRKVGSTMRYTLRTPYARYFHAKRRFFVITRPIEHKSEIEIERQILVSLDKASRV